MDASTNILLTLGILLLLGLSCHELGRRTHIPRVSLLLLVGTLASPKVFNLVPAEVHGLFPYVNQIALCMVGFLLGEQFIYRSLFQSGKLIWSTTLIQALFTAASVFFVLTMLKVPLVLALLLAGISPSTAPAATVDIIREGNFKGRLPTALLKIVAIDDALGIIMFALFLGGVATGSAPAASQAPYFCGAELIYRNDEMGGVSQLISCGTHGKP